MSGQNLPFICKTCGKEQVWIPIYRRYYCYTCKAYPPVCPRCFSDLSWIPQYRRYYCYRCQEYPQLIEEEKPGPPVVQVTPATALLEASPKGTFAKILNSIDQFSIGVQNAVGGFPKTRMPTSPTVHASAVSLRSGQVWKYIFLGLFVILLTSFFLFVVNWLIYLGLFIFSFIGPVLYLAWMWRTDRYEREPRVYLFVLFAMGFFTAIPAFILNSFIVGPLIGGLSAPIVEEVLKGLCILWIARKLEFNDAMDGMVYGFAAGMGFASAENFFYILYRYEGNLFLSILRVFLFGLGHGIYSSMAGRWIGKMKVLTGVVKNRFLLPGLIIAIMMHFIYNEVAGLILPVVGNIIWEIACILIVLSAVKQALGEERVWGYHSRLAPIK